MNISWHTIDLRLTDPFTISRETKKEKQNLIVRITDGRHTGLGEAAPSPFYGQSVRTVLDAMETMQGIITRSGESPESLAEKLGVTFQGDRAACAAMETALHDLAARRAGLPLHAYLGLNAEIPALTSFTVGIDSPDIMLEKAARAEQYPVIKVKLGFEGDMEVLETIRKATDKVVRVDANGGWSLEEAMTKFPILISLGVEYVEQPMPRGELEGLKALRDRFPLPILVDEDAVVPEDVPRLVGVVDGINIKLTKCGGLRPALKMVEEARKGGLKVMLGCMIESSVGITAAAHLASLVDYLDLDGNLLLDDDPFVGVRCEEGRLILPESPGLGVEER